MRVNTYFMRLNLSIFTLPEALEFAFTIKRMQKKYIYIYIYIYIHLSRYTKFRNKIDNREKIFGFFSDDSYEEYDFFITIYLPRVFDKTSSILN